MSKKDPFNDPKIINFATRMVIDGWHETLEGVKDGRVYVPKKKEAFIALGEKNAEKEVKRLIAAFEAKYGKKLKYRIKDLTYVSYVETEVGDEYDNTDLLKKE